MARSTLMSVLLVVLGILLPPLAVFVDEPKVNDEFFISILLTICGWLPGIIHAFWVIFFDGKGKLKMMDVLILVCCILLPPLGVFLKQQKITIDFLVALILCFLFWFPAIIFAIVVAFFGFSCSKAVSGIQGK